MLLQKIQAQSRLRALPSYNQHVDQQQPPLHAVQIVGRTAFRHARRQNFPQARRFFEYLLNTKPQMERAWISYAQMEKRSNKKAGDFEQAYHDCKKVLERGLTHNPHSSRIIQALGLLELQYNLHHGAVHYLETAAELDPACTSVLRWQRVQRAKTQCCQHCRDAAAAADDDDLDMLLLEGGYQGPHHHVDHASD